MGKEAPKVSEKAPRTPVTLEVYETPVLMARNTYRLRLVKPADFAFVSGQSMKFNFQNEQKENGTWRQPSFTIVSAPHEPYLEFVFRVPEKKEDWSPTKRALMNLSVGAPVPMLSVLNDQSDEVIYPPEKENGTPVVMLAGGVGIAPFISMLRHAQHIGDRRHMHLLYANPTAEDVVYEEEVEAHRHSLTPNLSVEKFLTKEEKEGYTPGYFTTDSLRPFLTMYGRLPLFFISGTQKMVEETKALLEKLQVPDSCIFVKEFKGYERRDDTIRE